MVVTWYYDVVYFFFSGTSTLINACRLQSRLGGGSTNVKASSLSEHAGRIRIRLYYKKYIKDISREFDEFQINTHIRKSRCWYL